MIKKLVFLLVPIFLLANNVVTKKELIQLKKDHKVVIIDAKDFNNFLKLKQNDIKKEKVVAKKVTKKIKKLSLLENIAYLEKNIAIISDEKYNEIVSKIMEQCKNNNIDKIFLLHDLKMRDRNILKNIYLELKNAY